MTRYRKFFQTIAAAALGLLAFSACGGEDTPDVPDKPASPENPTVAPASSDVIYEANPRLFADEKCIEAIHGQLPRLEKMGINILWLMPIQEPGEEKGIGSPYCIRDLKAMNPRYGTIDDVKKLVDDAHRRGIKVIIDWVAAQTSWDCPWIKEHPDFYRRNAAGEIVSPSSGSQVFADVAALNYSVRDLWIAMKDAMYFWLDKTGIDGFRFDFVEGTPKEFWQQCCSDLKERKPDIFLLAETGQLSYYSCGFDMVYDWGLQDILASAMKSGRLDNYYSKADARMAEVPEGKDIMRYIYSHDSATTDPIPGYYGSDDAMIAAYALTALYGGTPMIYSGMDAADMDGTINFFRYNPLEWSATLSERFAFVNKLYRSLAPFRNGKRNVVSNGAVATFTYQANGRTALVMVNTSDKEAVCRLPMAVQGLSFDTEEAYAVSFDDSMTSATLSPYGFTVIISK